MLQNDKLYVIVRKDLAPGLKAAQAAHALRQFTHEHPEIDNEWFHTSNYLALLEIENEQKLEELKHKIISANIKYAEFREPDLDNSLTGLTIEPGKISKKLVRHLPLAFS